MRTPAWCLLAAAVVWAQPAPPGFRLPDDVVPLNYTLELTIDPAADSFSGSAEIQVEIRKPVSTIWLNAKDLSLSGEAVRVSQGDTTSNTRAQVVGGEFIAIQADGLLRQGRARISLSFRGRLDDKTVVGAYRRQIEGRWYVFTTFTPIEARRVFPCFDEPRYKTPWNISIRVPKGDKAFSNALAREDPTDPTLFRFIATQPLPTELVAFAVGPFDEYQAPSAGQGTLMRVLAPKGHAAEGKIAAESAAALLPKLEAYTGIPYAFGKLDHLAMADGGFAAVENPGLIVYLAKELLIAPGTENAANTRAVRFLEAHEMGHQWFGDLVTQADWNDLWLSEGFATWIADKMMDGEGPRERAHLSSIASRERIMGVDASLKTHVVRMEVHSREDSEGIYNRLAYDKGAAVLLMLEGWLGEEKFREAIRGYLRDHRFGNAAAADLAEELKGASGLDVSAVLRSFLDSTGVPRIEAQVQCDRTVRLTIRQTGASAIPVCYRGDGITQTCDVLEGPSREITLGSCPSWVYLNAGGTGYYRVSWNNSRQLASLPLNQLTPAERLTLVYDLHARRTATGREVLMKLESDKEPEIAEAAREALK